MGIKADGEAVAWQFLHPGWGVVLINSVTDPSHATATVIMRLPDHVVTAAYATSLFAFEAWNTNDGYPNCVFFFRERLGYARGSQLWLSQPGDFFNFAERSLNNEITAESALSLTIAAATADPIRWARETPHGLLVGTDGGEFLVSEATTSEALSASNVRCTPQSAYGSRPMAPISIQHAILFIQRGGRRLREAVYDIMNESTKSRDLTVLSDHITRSGVTSLAFQQEPRRTMWATRQDGTLLSFTYDVEQDVYGWHRHPLGGNAFAECVCSIPSPDGQSDDLWIITNQIMGGKQYRMVQYLERGYQDGDDVRNAIYLDAAMVYEGAIRNGVNRFDFPMLANWIGQQVYVVADGVPCGWSTVLDLLGQALVQIPRADVHLRRHAHRGRLSRTRACSRPCGATKAPPMARRRARPSARTSSGCGFATASAARWGRTATTSSPSARAPRRRHDGLAAAIHGRRARAVPRRLRDRRPDLRRARPSPSHDGGGAHAEDGDQ
jgi:hypothetical protein